MPRSPAPLPTSSRALQDAPVRPRHRRRGRHRQDHAVAWEPFRRHASADFASWQHGSHLARSGLTYSVLADLLDGVEPEIIDTLPTVQRVALERVLLHKDDGHTAKPDHRRTRRRGRIPDAGRPPGRALPRDPRARRRPIAGRVQPGRRRLLRAPAEGPRRRHGRRAHRPQRQPRRRGCRSTTRRRATHPVGAVERVRTARGATRPTGSDAAAHRRCAHRRAVRRQSVLRTGTGPRHGR